MHEITVLLMIGVGTYLTRAALLLSSGEDPPAILTRFLPHVGPAVIAAITVPALLAPEGTVSLGATAPALVAAGATWALWARTRQLPTALLGGLGLWWGLLAVLPG